MRRALLLARRGWGRTAPNPLVGAVVVRDGLIVGEGWHAEFGGPHAEVEALAAAGPDAKGADLYVNLEPCDHHGKTPPCTEAIIAAGVARVIVGAPDVNPVASGGTARLRSAGIAVTEGLEREAAEELNAPFLFAHRDGARPFVTLKLALSADGAVAPADRNQRWLTGAKARREVHRLRAGVDAIAVGIGTALADDPLLTVRGVKKPRVAPVRVVFDRKARLPATAQLVKTAKKVPTWVIATTGAAAESPLGGAGVRLMPADGLADALGQLRREGVRHLLVEGGAELAKSFLDSRMVDRVIIFQSPVLLGAGALPAFGGASLDAVTAPWRVLDRRSFEEDVMTTYALPGR